MVMLGAHILGAHGFSADLCCLRYRKGISIYPWLQKYQGGQFIMPIRINPELGLSSLGVNRKHESDLCLLTSQYYHDQIFIKEKMDIEKVSQSSCGHKLTK